MTAAMAISIVAGIIYLMLSVCVFTAWVMGAVSGWLSRSGRELIIHRMIVFAVPVIWLSLPVAWGYFVVPLLEP